MIRRFPVRHDAWVLALAWMALANCAFGQSNWGASPGAANPYSGLVAPSNGPYPSTNGAPVVTQWPTQSELNGVVSVDENPNLSPTSANWIMPGDGQPNCVDANVYCDGDPYPQQQMLGQSGGPWFWQMLPEGLIYRTYWAGVHEPRMGVVMMRKNGGNSFWDATVGARISLLRFGNGDPIHPQGWEFDVDGAALPRLTLDNVRDLETVDFRGGAFGAYGIGDWQFKLGYDHLSSHLGDEFAIAHPGSLADRINYVRDSLIGGASYYPVPEMRIYSEVGYAMNATGGAEPWEFQFGTELAKAGPTGMAGTPFLALNVHLREEVDFGGDFTAQAGWLWRGLSGQTMRIGAHYFNGKSSQYQTYNEFEQQVGLGLWYDF
jgi:Protein of unknown function (DUF1207)